MNFKFQISNSSRGITLVEIIVVIFVIVLFSSIVIIGLPEIERRYSLSRSAYRLAQDLRKTRDLALSGVEVKDAEGKSIVVAGYGIYINMADNKKYAIYADISVNDEGGDQKYSSWPDYDYCKDQETIDSDCIVDIIDIGSQNKDLEIRKIKAGESDVSDISINFTPPVPIVNIKSLEADYDSIEIVLGLENSSQERSVFVNTSGLINIQP